MALYPMVDYTDPTVFKLYLLHLFGGHKRTTLHAQKLFLYKGGAFMPTF